MMKISGQNENTRVSATDTIFATVIACGRTVFRATYAGMSSLEDVISAIRNGAKNAMTGPVTVSLRSSQGWTLHRPMMRRTGAPEAT